MITWVCAECTFVNSSNPKCCDVCDSPYQPAVVAQSAKCCDAAVQPQPNPALPPPNPALASPPPSLSLDASQPKVVHALPTRSEIPELEVVGVKKPNQECIELSDSDDEIIAVPDQTRPEKTAPDAPGPDQYPRGSAPRIVIDLTSGEDDEVDEDVAFARQLQRELNQQATLSLREIRERQEMVSRDAQVAQELQNALIQQESEDAERQRMAIESKTDDWYDVLAEHRSNVQRILQNQARGLRIVDIAENPYSKPGQPLYNRFVTAWQEVQDQSVVTAFHGTAEENIDSICRTGLDPARRNGQAMGKGEYFGRKANIALGYCKGGRKMLLFALITDKSGLTADKQNILVIHKPEHQLPLFVVTFEDSHGWRAVPSAPPAPPVYSLSNQVHAAAALQLASSQAAQRLQALLPTFQHGRLQNQMRQAGLLRDVSSLETPRRSYKKRRRGE